MAASTWPCGTETAPLSPMPVQSTGDAARSRLHELASELVAMVRDEIGAVAAFRDVAVVGGLPKTRSGKILRKTMREIADGKDARVPSTIEDTDVLDSLRPVLSRD